MNRIFSNILSLLVIISLCSAQCGCSMVMPTRQRFSVTTSEPDAKIFVNGEYIGVGNVQTRVPRNQAVSVMAKKDGFYPVTREVDTEMSMVGILDIIGGCIFLLPFIGLAFPGSRSIDQNNLALVLEKESNK